MEKRPPFENIPRAVVDRDCLNIFEEEAERKNTRCLEIEQEHPEIKALVKNTGSDAYLWLHCRIEELHAELDRHEALATRTEEPNGS